MAGNLSAGEGFGGVTSWLIRYKSRLSISEIPPALHFN